MKKIIVAGKKEVGKTNFIKDNIGGLLKDADVIKKEINTITKKDIEGITSIIIMYVIDDFITQGIITYINTLIRSGLGVEQIILVRSKIDMIERKCNTSRELIYNTFNYSLSYINSKEELKLVTHTFPIINYSKNPPIPKKVNNYSLDIQNLRNKFSTIEEKRDYILDYRNTILVEKIEEEAIFDFVVEIEYERVCQLINIPKTLILEDFNNSAEFRIIFVFDKYVLNCYGNRILLNKYKKIWKLINDPTITKEGIKSLL